MNISFVENITSAGKLASVQVLYGVGMSNPYANSRKKYLSISSTSKTFVNIPSDRSSPKGSSKSVSSAPFGNYHISN